MILKIPILQKIKSYPLTRKTKRKCTMLISALFLAVVTIIMLETGDYADSTKVVSNAIRAIVLGPGIGEFTYETKVIYDNGHPLNASHTDKNVPSIIEIINDLRSSYPNLTKISLIVSWYSDSTNIAEAHIVPMVGNKTGPNWQVGDYTRANTEVTRTEVTRTSTHDRFNVSGTPTDRSIVELCTLLNKEGIEVTLYPNILIKDSEKHLQEQMIFKNEYDIEAFFQEYSKFIMHYATLEYKGTKLSDNIKALVIASGMQALTDYKNDQNEFVAVNKLINLAARVRSEVGPRVKISYAANWSEYHRTNNDWYNLDTLWADKNIDFIGINAYFPLTDHVSADKDITPEVIAQGWSHHEVSNNTRVASDSSVPKPEIAVKDIGFWWRNPHKNPDGKISSWEPKMKPIVFNEVGFAALDHTSNEPSKSIGANSKDHGVPNGSKGEINPKFQYDAVMGTIQYTEGLFSQPDNEGILAGVFWYKVDPRGHSPDWIHNHELKVSEVEKGLFNKLEKLDIKNIEDFSENQLFQNKPSIEQPPMHKVYKLLYDFFSEVKRPTL